MALDFTKIACLGDSLTAGMLPDSSIVPVPYPARITADHTPFVATNYGVGGNNTTQMLARWRSTVQPTDAGILCLWGGINDVLNDGTAGAITANLDTIRAEALADGRRVILFTLAPWAGVTWGPPNDWNASRQAMTEAVNTWVRAQVGATVRACETYSSALNDGTGKLAGAYDGGDHLHFNQAGYDVVAGLAWSALAATPPVVTGLTLPPAPHRSTSVPITVAATQGVFSVSQYAVTVDTLSAPSSWQASPSFSLTVPAGAHTLRAYARDTNGNVSAAYSASLTVYANEETVTLRRWNGSAWEPLYLYRYNGTTWVEMAMRRRTA